MQLHNSTSAHKFLECIDLINRVNIYMTRNLDCEHDVYHVSQFMQNKVVKAPPPPLPPNLKKPCI